VPKGQIRKALSGFYYVYYEGETYQDTRASNLGSEINAYGLAITLILKKVAQKLWGILNGNYFHKNELIVLQFLMLIWESYHVSHRAQKFFYLIIFGTLRFNRHLESKGIHC